MKVFLSSTYLDLIEHRKEAAEALTRLGHHVIGMETFNARAEDPTKASTKEVAECELFVGIYAHRYGSLIGKAKKSVTEQEFDHALKKGKEIFTFFVDENFSWPPKMVDKDAEQIKKLSVFKKKIVDHVTPDYFTDKTDLAYKIVSAVKSHIARTDSRIPIPASPKPTGSTLPTQPYFFGRDKELAIIADAISPDSRTWGALIDGPGGIGKTALSIKAAHDAPEKLFERKIFISAKVRELTPEGEKPLKDFSRDNYFSMLNELALELGEEGIPRLAPDERANQLRMAMAGKKTLIVFDNLETLSEDERTRLFQFLSRLPEGNKAIVTSRRRADVDARVIRLDRLSANEALQLIEELSKNNSRLAREDEKARRDLYEITNGNPLLIKWVCAQLGREGSAMHTITEACKFIENAPKDNDPLEYIFGDLLETFTDSETKVLAALTHFAQPAKLNWIAEMTGLAEQATETALEDLTDRSILVSYSEIQEYFLPPLAAQFIRTKRIETVNHAGNRLADIVYLLVVKNDTYNREKYSTVEEVWPLILAGFLPIAIAESNYLQELCERFPFSLDITTHIDDYIWLCERAEEKAQMANDVLLAGLQAYRISQSYLLFRETDKALACIDRAENHWKNAGNTQLGLILYTRSQAFMTEENYTDAISTAKRALKLWQAENPQHYLIALGLEHLADAQRYIKDYTEAEQNYREANRIATLNDDQGLICSSKGRLAELALDKEEWAKAETIAREALELAETNMDHINISNNCRRIAKALTRQGRASDGLPFADRAIEIVSHFHKLNPKEAREVLAECEAAILSDAKRKTKKAKKKK